MYKNKKRALRALLVICILVFSIGQAHAMDDMADLFELVELTRPQSPDNGQQALETQQPGPIQQAWQGLLEYARPVTQTAGTFARRFFPTLRRLVYFPESDVKEFAKLVTDPKYMPDRVYVQTKIEDNPTLLNEYDRLVNDAIFGAYEGLQSDYLLNIERLYYIAKKGEYPNVVTTDLMNTFEKNFLDSMEDLIQNHYPTDPSRLTTENEASGMLLGYTSFNDPSLFSLPVDLFCKLALSSFFDEGVKYRISVFSEYAREYQTEIEKIRQQFPLTPVSKNTIVNALKNIRILLAPIRKK